MCVCTTQGSVGPRDRPLKVHVLPSRGIFSLHVLQDVNFVTLTDHIDLHTADMFIGVFVIGSERQ